MSDQIMTQVDKKGFLWKAWIEYKETEDYKNSWRHADTEEHRDGSLWAAFVEGWGRSNRMRRKYSIMTDFEWAKKVLEKMLDYSITPMEGGDYKVVWIEDGEHNETFESEWGIIEILDQLTGD